MNYYFAGCSGHRVLNDLHVQINKDNPFFKSKAITGLL